MCVTWPRWPPRPYIIKTLQKSSFLEPAGSFPRNLVCSIRDSCQSYFVQMMTLEWPWPILRQGFSKKLLGHFQPNFVCMLSGTRKIKSMNMILVTWPRWWQREVVWLSMPSDQDSCDTAEFVNVRVIFPPNNHIATEKMSLWICFFFYKWKVWK